MIDFETDGPKTYAALQPLLEKYRFMLTEFADKAKTKAVTIVIPAAARAPRWENKPSAWQATTGGCPILVKGEPAFHALDQRRLAVDQVARQG